MELHITDGVTTVTLSGGAPVLGCTYFPMPPEADTADLVQPQAVTETATVNLRGPHDAVRSVTNSVERLLDAAQRRAKLRAGRRVFLLYRPVPTDELYRSEVYAGQVAWSEEPGLRRLKDDSPTVQVAVIVTRASWWEGPETELPLSTNAQGAGTGGRTITNNGDSNFVQIAASAVGGSLPAPLRLMATNAEGYAQLIRAFYAGVNAFAAPIAPCTLQAENRTSGSGSVQNQAAASGGRVLSVGVPVGDWAYTTWTLPSSLMAAGGRRLRLIANVFTASYERGIAVKPEMLDASGAHVLWEGGEAAVAGAGPLDLGAVPVPPGGWAEDYAAVRLALLYRARTAGGSLLLDYLQLMGVDGFRKVQQLGPYVSAGAAVEFDEIEQRWGVVEGFSRYAFHVATGPGLHVYPGVTQRIRIMHDGATASRFTVRAYYRPRRPTV